MQKLVVGNLKMNLLSPAERDHYLMLFRKELQGKRMTGAELVLCPPYIHLENLLKSLKHKNISFGAQDAFWEKSGAFTGEVSAEMIKNIGAVYVIMGHSERRRILGETDETVNKKVLAVLKAGLTPIMCIGETLEQRKAGGTKQVTTAQLQRGLDSVRPSQLDDIVIAYEPIWSVGTDVTPTANEIMSAKLLIKKVIADRWGVKYADRIRVIYGGSVNARTAVELCTKPEMDGVLVGRESLSPGQLIKIAEKVS